VDFQIFLSVFWKNELERLNAISKNASRQSKRTTKSLFNFKKHARQIGWADALYFRYITSNFKNRRICNEIGISTDCFLEIKNELNLMNSQQV
jgi:hypothetical protein